MASVKQLAATRKSGRKAVGSQSKAHHPTRGVTIMARKTTKHARKAKRHTKRKAKR